MMKLKTYFFLALIYMGNSALGQLDTNITYWDNDNKRKMIIYKVIDFYDGDDNIVRSFKEVKKTKYYDLNGKKTSLKKYQAIEREYESDDKADEIATKMDEKELNTSAKIQGYKMDKNTVHLIIPEVKERPFKVNLYLAFEDDSLDLNYVKKDTLINKTQYQIQVFNPSRALEAAIRMDGNDFYLKRMGFEREELVLSLDPWMHVLKSQRISIADEEGNQKVITRPSKFNGTIKVHEAFQRISN